MKVLGAALEKLLPRVAYVYGSLGNWWEEHSPGIILAQDKLDLVGLGYVRLG